MKNSKKSLNQQSKRGSCSNIESQDSDLNEVEMTPLEKQVLDARNIALSISQMVSINAIVKMAIESTDNVESLEPIGDSNNPYSGIPIYIWDLIKELTYAES